MTQEAITKIEKENVLIQVGDCTVTVLPQFGGKVSSILVRPRIAANPAPALCSALANHELL